jgi:hypothetical protein
MSSKQSNRCSDEARVVRAIRTDRRDARVV